MASLPHDHGNCAHSILEQMPDNRDFGVMADLFKQLSDPTRVRIFWILCHCEECVINLSAMMEMSSPAVSHHLKQLRAAGLISSRREGKEVYYKAADGLQARLLHNIIEKAVAITCPDTRE
jgi:DNA-binding transcriptional ArsR family regulator